MARLPSCGGISYWAWGLVPSRWRQAMEANPLGLGDFIEMIPCMSATILHTSCIVFLTPQRACHSGRLLRRSMAYLSLSFSLSVFLVLRLNWAPSVMNRYCCIHCRCCLDPRLLKKCDTLLMNIVFLIDVRETEMGRGLRIFLSLFYFSS